MLSGSKSDFVTFIPLLFFFFTKRDDDDDDDGSPFRREEKEEEEEEEDRTGLMHRVKEEQEESISVSLLCVFVCLCYNICITLVDKVLLIRYARIERKD